MRGKLDSNSGIKSGKSLLTTIRLRWHIDDSFTGAGKRATNFLRSTSKEASSHSSRPSRIQYVVPRIESRTILSKILQSVSNDEPVNRDFFWILKLGKM